MRDDVLLVLSTFSNLVEKFLSLPYNTSVIALSSNYIAVMLHRVA